MALGLLLFAAGAAHSQDLEPRAFSPAPVGLNFVALGYGYSFGNVLLDPAVPITDGEATLHSLVAGYVRTIDVFGMAGKADVIVPFVVHGDWKGVVQGVPDSTTRTGFGDPMFRLAVNFVGAPAERLPEFAGHRHGAVVGASLQVVAPLGLYEAERIVNLGSNRWVFKPRIGVSYPIGQWILETHATAWFFTDNPDANGARLEQAPMWAMDAHVARVLRNGIWFSVDIGYIQGGRTTRDGVPSTEQQESVRFGATLALPVTSRHSLKFGYFTGLHTRLGSDFDNLVVAWQYRWGGGI